jgi:hypothetical protein
MSGKQEQGIARNCSVIYCLVGTVLRGGKRKILAEIESKR